MRHVLRPHVGRPAPDVRDRVSQPGADLRSAATIARERREQPVNIFRFGTSTSRTKVFMMMPAENVAVHVDVMDYMWEEKHVKLRIRLLTNLYGVKKFSFQTSEDRYVLRRQFGKFLVLTSFGMFAGQRLDSGEVLAFPTASLPASSDRAPGRDRESAR